MVLMLVMTLASTNLGAQSPTEGVLNSTFVNESDMKADLLQMLANFSLYMNNNWYQCAATNSIDESCGYFLGENSGGNNEQGVRHNADMSMICAFLVKYGKPAGVTLPSGVTWAKIEEMALKSLIFAYSTHKANKLKVCSGNNYWGSTSTSDYVWESSLWAMSVAYSAFFQWDKLNDAQKNYIYLMLKAECNYELGRSIPTGFAGDTKAEENGWEVDILAATLGLFPEDELADQWFQRMRKFAVNSYSHATDQKNNNPIDPNYNGDSPADLFVGKNLYDDYTLQNHNMFHTSYQNVVMQEIGEAALALKMFQQDIHGTEKWKSNSLMHNNQEVMDQILNWLATSDGELAMPNGNDWSLFLFDQITSYSTQACFNRDPNALLLENLAYKNIKARQTTTSDGSWLLRADVGSRRMGVEAHRVMMTYLMHEYMPTNSMTPTSWEQFRKDYQKTKFFPNQNIVRSMSKDRFTCFSWNTSLPDYSGVIVPNDIDKAKIMVPFRTHHTGNLLGVYNRADYTTDISGRYAIFPDAYAMNGRVIFNNIPQAFCLYATSGNAVILVDALKASTESSVSVEQGGMMGISVDDFTNTTRTIYYNGGNVTTDGSSYATWTSPWANIDNYLGFVVTKHGETVTGAFGDKSNNNSINTAKIYPSYSDATSTVGTSMNHIRGFVYYNGVSSTETATLSNAVVDLTTLSTWPEGWHGILVPDPDGTYYMLLSNLYADDDTPWENLAVSCPNGAPVFRQVTAISGTTSTATFYCTQNFNIANELKVFVNGATGINAVQEDGNSRAIYIQNPTSSAKTATVKIIDEDGTLRTGTVSIPKNSTKYVYLNGTTVNSSTATFPGNYRNVAYGTSVDANSYHGAHLPLETIDNDEDSYYLSLNNASSGNEALTINLRNNYKINKVTVKTATGLNQPSKVIVHAATTEGTFSQITPTSYNNEDGTITILFSNKVARFVKLQLFGSGQVAVNEVAVFGEETTDNGDNDGEITSEYIANPSFEIDDVSNLTQVTESDGKRGYDCPNPTGWTLSGSADKKYIVTEDCYTDNNFGQVSTIPDGTQAFYLRMGWTSGTISATTTTSSALPAGSYRMAIKYRTGYANGGSSFALTAAGNSSSSITFNKGSLSAWTTATIDFNISSAQTVTMGINVNWVSGGSCIMIDDLQLYEITETDQVQTNKDNIISNGGDATFLLQDPTCESGSTYWNNSTAIGWLSESWKGGGTNPYVERTSNGTVSQTLTNMPAGTYKLVAALRANTGCKITPRLNSTSGNTFTGTGNASTTVDQINKNGIQMPYNDERGFAAQNSTCHGWQWGSATATLAADGELTVAFDMVGSSWMSIDDVHLYYVSDGTNTYCESVNADASTTQVNTTKTVTADIILANPNTVIKSEKQIYTDCAEANNNLVAETSMKNLVLYDDYDFECTATSGYQLEKASYVRNMPEYQWGTVIMPFPLTSNDNIQFYKMIGVNDSYMYFSEIDEVEANTPVVFRRAENITKASLSATNQTAVGTDQEFGTGGIDTQEWNISARYQAGDYYGDAYYIAQDKFYKSPDSEHPKLTIPAFRAFITSATGLSVKKLDIKVGKPDDTTPITNINAETPSTPTFYNIAGQRINRPSKGIFISEGKKFIIK